jgi:hypothetical protein
VNYAARCIYSFCSKLLPTVFKVGLATTVPAVAALYHLQKILSAVAVKVWIGEASHSVLFPPLTGAAGTAFIVKVTAVSRTYATRSCVYRLGIIDFSSYCI